MRWQRSARYRRNLIATASRLTDAGWLILPGAWWSSLDGRHRCDLTSCVLSSVHPAPVGCHDGALCPPTGLDLTAHAVTGSDDIEPRWTHRPYTLLALTGLGVDVADAPPSVARVMVDQLRRRRVPILSAAVDGRGLIFVTTGAVIDPERRHRWARHGILYHQRNSWVALPPSIIDGRPSRWQSRPPLHQPSLTPAKEITGLLDQLAGARGGRGHGTARAPRNCTTGRVAHPRHAAP